LGITQKDISVPLATLYSHNTKAVDDEAPRLTFVRHAVEFQLTGDHPPELSIPVHPNHASMGLRGWKLNDGRIWLEGEDLEKMDLRLKEFADVGLHDQEARVESIERSDKRPIVHWLPASQSVNAVVLSTKDDTIVHTEGQLERHKHKAGTIVQLERVGYAIVIDNVTLLLCHEESQEQ
jgi:glutamyl/glutaminyl-tRNA synthetase